MTQFIWNISEGQGCQKCLHLTEASKSRLTSKKIFIVSRLSNNSSRIDDVNFCQLFNEDNYCRNVALRLISTWSQQFEQLVQRMRFFPMSRVFIMSYIGWRVSGVRGEDIRVDFFLNLVLQFLWTKRFLISYQITHYFVS